MATSVRLYILALGLWVAPRLQAQVEVMYQGKPSKATVIGQDTIPWIFLDEVMVLDQPTFSDAEARLNYLRLKRRVIKVYPYKIAIRSNDHHLMPSYKLHYPTCWRYLLVKLVYHKHH